MTLLEALAYFLREASQNLVRGWRISVLAIATTALSLFIGGAFLLLGANLGGAVQGWRSEARIVIYLSPQVTAEQLAVLKKEVAAISAVETVREIGPVEAAERFQARFPELAEMAEDLEVSPLPASLEIEAVGTQRQVEQWLEGLADLPGVVGLDDDGRWLERMDAAASVANALGLLIGGALMVAAAISIASVVRISTFVYRREISAMRLIGATEFFVRGPFVAEGLLQGLVGSSLALLALWLGYQGLGLVDVPWLVRDALLRSFLSTTQVLAIGVMGGLAGLIGGIIPLRERTSVFG